MPILTFQTVASPLVIPLPRAFLCLDCDAIFPRATGEMTRSEELSPGCPVCGTSIVYSVSAWLNRATAPQVTA